jgi:cobalt-zinc-cadmium efflux system protein
MILDQRRKALRIVFLLTSVYFIVQVLTALWTSSLALLSDSGHMLTDVGGLGMALLAISYSVKPATPRRTYGFYRSEILASLINSLFLILLSVYIFYEGYQRIQNPTEVLSVPMIAVATVGLAINLIGMKLIGGHSHKSEDKSTPHHHQDDKIEENLNMRGAYLEVLADMLGSVGVIVAGIIIFTTKFYLADPIISILLAAFILPRTWILLKKAVHILIEGTPSHISQETVKNAILQIKGVTGLFDLHIWTITSGIHCLSAHVVIIDMSRSQATLHEINSVLEKKFGMVHATLQLERYHDVGSHRI